jgi:hypothetical protein
MKKKALIVGISDYAPLQPSLKSSAVEIAQWRDLLVERFEFADADIRLVAERRATKTAIIDRLMWLLGDARPGDQLVFIFCGHGVRARRRDSAGDLLDLQDEGLVPHPGGAVDPLDVAIFDDDLMAVYCSMAVPAGARPTFIFDCCYSGGIDFSEPDQLRKSIILPVDLAHRNRGVTNVVRFGLGVTRTDVCVHPVIVTASGERDVAIEVGPDDDKRSLFSSHAIAALRENPALSYQDLITTITPLMKSDAQQPCLHGDAERIQGQFFK